MELVHTGELCECMDQEDKTYRTRLLEFLAYEHKQLEEERARIDERLLEIRAHMSAITKDKAQGGDLLIERTGRGRRIDR